MGSFRAGQPGSNVPGRRRFVRRTRKRVRKVIARTLNSHSSKTAFAGSPPISMTTSTRSSVRVPLEPFQLSLRAGSAGFRICRRVRRRSARRIAGCSVPGGISGQRPRRQHQPRIQRSARKSGRAVRADRKGGRRCEEFDQGLGLRGAPEIGRQRRSPGQRCLHQVRVRQPDYARPRPRPDRYLPAPSRPCHLDSFGPFRRRHRPGSLRRDRLHQPRRGA
jgi:hypothetical protein